MTITTIKDVGAFTDNSLTLVNNGLGDVLIPSTTINVVSSATLADITGMTTNLTNGTYVVDITLAGTSGASGGWKVGFNYTNGLTMSAVDVTGYAQTASSVVFPNRVSSTTAQTAIISSTSAVVAGNISGVLTVSAPGTLAVQFAQNASNATSSTIYPGSVGYIRKVA